MDNNVVSSLSDMTDNSSSSEESFLGEDTVVDEKSESNSETVVKIVSDTEIGFGDDSRNRDLLLDLRNLTDVNYDFKNGEDKYEKLSEVIEEPEDLPTEVAILHQEHVQSCSKDESESQVLQERIDSLKDVISALRAELKTEVSLWRKERNEFQMLQERNDLFALEEATAAARAAAEAYAAESPLSRNLDGMQYNCSVNFPGAGEIFDVNPEQTLSELTILEYEKKLAKYQDALALAQAEKRYNMRRQIAVNSYRQKLIEVERLCDEELEKIKQNASSLQPLKQMVSQWYISDRCGGDAAVDGCAGPSAVDNCVYKSPPLSYKKDHQWSNYTSVDTKKNANKIDAEVNMAPEIFVAKFNNNDATGFQLQSGSMVNETNWIINDHDGRHCMNGGGNSALSLKWESSNYTLSTSLGNP